ncbi:ATP-binding protein [Acrocarpospora phusangensis]|uniref:ATP-binding protein n=1 Tax=Acrocarpospora phusangensis TaxID=1070424 RepID=A0A919UKL6_9ACTN|nr:ATP-binding protein [Acrocarpospora phusangensis]GIH25144.1 ATP-binding protein [Acrocarpospora phusangensis]
MTEAEEIVAGAGVAVPDAADGEQAKEEKKSASTVLVELAQASYRFGVSEAGETFGVPRVGSPVVFLLRGGKTSLRAQLARAYFARVRKAAPQQALADALLVIEGFAQEENPERLEIRVARSDGAFWLDLGDPTGRAVRIKPGGWTIEDEPPVLFKRTALTLPLPLPVRGGSLDELWEWLNFDPADRPLVVAWLVSLFFPEMPHPVPNLSGEQGSGKSTAGKVMSLIVDPTGAPARKAPRDPESWVTAATGSWVVSLDNLSDMPPWLSDAICRAVTGDGDVRRKLYTNTDLEVISFRRCVILNGIDLGAVRGDLADRLIPLDLLIIGEDNRLEEEELWPSWQEAHPRILGAVLDMLASVASQLPSVRLARKPRMADFARILKAVDELSGTDGLARYLSKQKALATDSLTADVFIVAVAEKIDTTFTGTASELLVLVTPDDDGKWRAPKGWPGTARAVTTRLRRQAPPMRKAGWMVEDDGGANHSNAVRWTLTPPPREVGDSGSLGSHSSRSLQGREFASQASQENGPSQVVPCTRCGLPLHPAAAAGGHTTHPSC